MAVSPVPAADAQQDGVGDRERERAREREREGEREISTDQKKFANKHHKSKSASVCEAGEAGDTFTIVFFLNKNKTFRFLFLAARS